MTHRQLKKEVLERLRAADQSASRAYLCNLPARQVVNPLFGLLYRGEDLLRWRAITAMGAVVAKLADENIESARIIMRRFLWNLNDESGGMGWGSPEAMGEIMARHHRLAGEYARILVSYADPNGNFLEHPGLQQGVLWALGRLGRRRPHLVRHGAGLLAAFLQSPHAALRGLSAWAARPMMCEDLRPYLSALSEDQGDVSIYSDDEITACRISRLARKALASMG